MNFLSTWLSRVSRGCVQATRIAKRTVFLMSVAILTVLRGQTYLQIKDDMDLRISTSTFEREGRRELEGQMTFGSGEKERVTMVKFDTV